MIKVAIIEDNTHYRTTLATLLHYDEQVSLIHLLEDCESMIGLFEFDKPDVVLMDIDLPGINGIQGVWEVKKRWPEIKILMLTVFEDEDKLFSAIKAGANGYLLKKDSPQKILDSVVAVHRGESPMNGMIAAKILDHFQQQQQTTETLQKANLTDREMQILKELIKGYSYKEIANSIFISTETFNSHIKNIYRKLNVHSRSELAAKYGDGVS